MSVGTVTLSALAAVVATTSLLPPGAAAQVLQKSAPPPAAAPALELESRARPWLDQPKQWLPLARLLEQAGRMRAADDPGAVDDLLVAAGAYRAVGKLDRARSIYVEAGERALALGDIVQAAHAFLRSAILASQQQDLATAWELRTRAERLAQSPLLPEVHRRRILMQFYDIGAVQVAGPR